MKKPNLLIPALLLVLLVVPVLVWMKKDAPEPPKIESKPIFDPNNNDHVTIGAAIRSQIDKPEGELTKTDLEKVELLYLGDNGITDVSALAGLKKLNALFLGGNQLTDVNALVGLKKLKVLSLANNQLTDVNALAKLKELERLSLEHNPRLTKAEIDKLQKALPNCTILHNAKESAADIIVSAQTIPTKESAADIIVAPPGVPTEGLVRMKGQGTIKYKGIFNRATSPERQIALDKALVSCIDRYMSMLGKSRYEIFVKNALSTVEKNPAPYVGANTIVTEAADVTTKTFRIVVEAEVNATKLNALLEAMLPKGGLSEDDALMSFVAMARFLEKKVITKDEERNFALLEEAEEEAKKRQTSWT